MNNKRKTGVWLVMAGLLCIVFAGAILLYNDWETDRAEQASLDTAQALLEYINEGEISAEADMAVETVSAEGADSDLPVTELSEVLTTGEGANSEGANSEGGGSFILLDETAYLGVLSIPDYGLDLPVNCVLNDSALKRTPCRYSGAVERDSLVIAGHNYSSHFGKIVNMTEGQPVAFTDAQGAQYAYTVANIEDVDPESTYDVVNSDYDLVMFTCDYSGQARVVVGCDRVE